MTREQLEHLLERFLRAAGKDPIDFPPGCAEYRAGLLLLAADQLGTTDTARLNAVTGLDATFITACDAQLRASAVWIDDQSNSAAWWQPHGALGLMMDILVALGKARRTTRDGEIRWGAALTNTA